MQNNQSHVTDRLQNVTHLPLQMSHHHTFNRALLMYSNAQIMTAVRSCCYYPVEDWNVLLFDIKFLIIFLPETQSSRAECHFFFSNSLILPQQYLIHFTTVTCFERFSVYMCRQTIWSRLHLKPSGHQGIASSMMEWDGQHFPVFFS